MYRNGKPEIKNQIGIQNFEPLSDFLLPNPFTPHHLLLTPYSLSLIPYHFTFLVKYMIRAMITNKARLPASNA